jgi:hypothetical protein
MITVIDNNQRVFLIEGLQYPGKDIFCNLADIPKVLRKEFFNGREFRIRTYEKDRLKHVSAELINKMFVSAQIDFKL